MAALSVTSELSWSPGARILGFTKRSENGCREVAHARVYKLPAVVAQGEHEPGLNVGLQSGTHVRIFFEAAIATFHLKMRRLERFGLKTITHRKKTTLQNWNLTFGCPIYPRRIPNGQRPYPSNRLKKNPTPGFRMNGI
jgi:hypothetical protein